MNKEERNLLNNFIVKYNQNHINKIDNELSRTVGEEFIKGCRNEYLEYIQEITNNFQLYKNIVHSTYSAALSEACELDRLEIVRYLLTEPLFSQYSQKEIESSYCLSKTCKYGAFDVLKFLLTSKEMKKNYNLHAKNNKALFSACTVGNLEIVKYLLTSPELKEHALLDKNSGKELAIACENGHLDVVKYLLTSPELKEHANIHANGEYALAAAIEYQQLDVVKYLLTSTELDDHADINYLENRTDRYNSLIELAYRPGENHQSMLEFLIFEVKIEINEHIKQYMVSRPNVKSLVEKFLLNEKLEAEVIPRDIYNNKYKI